MSAFECKNLEISKSVAVKILNLVIDDRVERTLWND